jgi:hypothetical protein
MLKKSKWMTGSSILVALLAVMIFVSTCAEDPVTPPPAKPPQIPTNGLLAFYPFDGNALDASGNGNNATLWGATVTTFLTLGDNAVEYVALPDTMFEAMGDFTISVWARITTLHTRTGGIHSLISGAIGYQTNMLLLDFDPPSNVWALTIRGIGVTFGPSATMRDLGWHHVVALRNGSIGRFYLDGQEIGDGLAITDVVINVGPGGLLLGQDQDSVGGGFEGHQSWAGDLDNLRIYNRALNNSEINLLYKETGWGD